jgi:hypothetical protein
VEISIAILSLLILLGLAYGVISLLASEGKVHQQEIHDYNYDEVEHANYWDADNVR